LISHFLEFCGSSKTISISFTSATTELLNFLSSFLLVYPNLLNHAFVSFLYFYYLDCTSLGSLGHDDLAEMHLHPNPVFSIPSDNIYMTCMTGTQSGRIFLGGKDGCVYEVAYQVSLKGMYVGSYTQYAGRHLTCFGHLIGPFDINE